MNIIRLLGEGKFYDMQVYPSKGKLEKEAIPFSGTLRPHHNINLIYLLTEPLKNKGLVYEFLVQDILHAEELPSRTSSEGITVEMARIWVKKECMAMKIEPVLVTQTLSNVNDFNE